MSEFTNRNIGLDLIRAMAIIMVLISHSRHILHADSFLLGDGMWRLSVCGFYGVELFFVLSGFLIGRILIKMLTSGNINNWANILLFLKEFWVRRWFRTIPLYILMFIVNYVLFFGGNSEHIHIPLWKYLLFWQNYDPVSLSFFPESWSLCVEEWFYVTIPITLTISYKYRKNVSFVIVSVILLVTFARIIYVLYVGSDNLMWDYQIRRNTFLRLDSLGIGMILACIFLQKKAFEIFSSKQALILGLCGILFNMFLFMNNREFVESIYAKTVLFNTTSISWGLVMCYAYNIKIEQKFGGGGITLLSKISYSVYLIHLPIVAFVAEYTLNIHSMIYKGLLYCCTWILVFILSYFMYRYYEYPIMNLRDKV